MLDVIFAGDEGTLFQIRRNGGNEDFPAYLPFHSLRIEVKGPLSLLQISHCTLALANRLLLLAIFRKILDFIATEVLSLHLSTYIWQCLNSLALPSLSSHKLSQIQIILQR